jgi:glycosyltransferase involved in cell wall biosynthesis
MKGASCLCLTYGRPFLLEEAIESFLRQDWDGPKELIVLNDHPFQELVFRHPEITIVNLNSRIRSLGEKRNFSISLAKYDRLLVWDDDDIHLPWRISETMQGLDKGPFFKCPVSWLWEEKQGGTEKTLRRSDSGFHCASAFHRSVFDGIGGYGCINAGEDQDFERRMRQHPNLGRHWHCELLPLDRVYYIYRWHRHYHASHTANLDQIEPIVREGIYRLSPNWSSDYCREVADLLALGR